jgi:small ligand-binding sensory domain FIST
VGRFLDVVGLAGRDNLTDERTETGAIVLYDKAGRAPTTRTAITATFGAMSLRACASFQAFVSLDDNRPPPSRRSASRPPVSLDGVSPAAETNKLWRVDSIGAIMHVVDAASGAGKTGCYASALSQHPDSAHAAAEVTAEVLDRLGPTPALAAVFVTPSHREAVGDIGDVVRSVLRPVTLWGAAAVAVLGPGREVEEAPGVSLFAARLSSPAVPVRLRAEGTRTGWQISGFPSDVAGARSLLLVADPFTFPVDALLDALERDQPGLAVVGGMASANGPGGNRLLMDDSWYTDGAVGVLLAEDVSPQVVVSQGCRPIGRPYIVTRADGHVIYELAGRPALERLLATLEHLQPAERQLAEQGLHCGVVIDETKVEFQRGDFLIRGVLGVDRAAGAVAVGDTVAVGSTVQFQVRDATTADEDLHAALSGRAARAALVFTCNGRGRRLFVTPDHDATVVADLLGTSALAGMFCAGELGPVGGRNAVHGFTASVAIFT